MKRYQLTIGGVELNPTVPPQAVRRTGGGRSVMEAVSINGTVMHTRGHRTARRIQITSPGPEWVLLSDQVAALQALTAGAAFTVTFGEGYETAGTFTGCLFDGDAVFEPKRQSAYANYNFTIYIPQEA
ncbi:hypothetical protein ACFP9V_19070 [Deinococcus radiopugnans]|uniref:Uncharacterized protein n=1 Tax=Deinococcus radiopugnans ATCC 19172 TaxID=585398 RepID=A0A5C4Y8J5_9DEIO|nr:hypothetical protein [Deinococcus radiopugnans]MBB6016808.1 hypothetical protein [Deinococcus radiopugnans ATCC 19172]TNM71903.1 hypothetical protein FHR04_05920 [Deinococcus radiopugnans ATCC 19172]